MKRILIIATMFTALLFGQGLYAYNNKGLTEEEILAAIPDGTSKTADELTVAEWAALAGTASVARQEDRYVSHAEFLSFIAPGTGQFLVGDYSGGALYVASELAIIGGTFAAWWFLLPSDLQDLSLSRKERHSLMEEYRDSGDRLELLPAAGAVAAGLTLSIINSVLSSTNAGNTARANIESGKVSFEPQIYMAGNRLGFGMRMKIR